MRIILHTTWLLTSDANCAIRKLRNSELRNNCICGYTHTHTHNGISYLFSHVMLKVKWLAVLNNVEYALPRNLSCSRNSLNVTRERNVHAVICETQQVLNFGKTTVKFSTQVAAAKSPLVNVIRRLTRKPRELYDELGNYFISNP